MVENSFGFNPDESTHHFLLYLPTSKRDKVLIAEKTHFKSDESIERIFLTINQKNTEVKILLEQSKWLKIVDQVRLELNIRLKQIGLKGGKFVNGSNYLHRLIGKELTLLCWAIEDADPGIIDTAVKNWLGLKPEERWWLYTTTNAATGHPIDSKNRGWRKAVRFALTENPTDFQLPKVEPSISTPNLFVNEDEILYE